MATPDQIAQFRLLIAEPDDTKYSDETLSALIDSSTSVNAAASSIWTQKAAASATLVNVAESGSSRSLGDLYRNALAMAAQFDKAAGADAATAPGIRIRRISRP